MRFRPSRLTGVTIVVTISFVLSGGRSRCNTGPGTFGCVVVLAKLIFVLVTPRGLSATVLLFNMIYVVVFVKQMSTGGLFKVLKLLTLMNKITMKVLVTVPTGALRGAPKLRHFRA